MDKLCDIVINDFCKRNIISKDRKEVYAYGLKLIFSDIINFSIVFFIGILFKHIMTAVAFLCTLCIIRRFSGGYHAKTFWLCRLSMIILFILTLMLEYFISDLGFKNILVVINNTFCFLFISYMSPIEHINKPLSPRLRKKNKKKSIIVSCILAVLSVILCFFNCNAGITISITMLFVAILIAIALMTKKGRRVEI